MSSEKVRMPYGSPVSERVSRREREAGQLGSVLGVVGATAVFASAVVLAVVFHNMVERMSNMEHEIANSNARHEKEMSNMEKEMSNMMIEVGNLKARAERDQQETVTLRERVAVLESQNRGMNFPPNHQDLQTSNTGSVLNPQADDVTVVDSELPSKNDSVGGLLRRRKRNVPTPNWVRVPIGPSGCQSGRDGRDGIPGAAGIPGPKGDRGSAGLQGSEGQKGDRGTTGLQGSKGQQGIRGSTGLQGSKGQKGTIGSTGPKGPGGAVYVRWGRTTCPSGATKVYNGYAGGTKYNQPGGGTNYQCLPTDPQWGRYQDGVQGYKAYMYGAEYQLYTSTVPFGSTSLHDDNVPCAVCYVPTRGSKLMIPARNTCYSGWTREYHGYLMAEWYNTPGSKEYVCVDEQPEAVPGGHADHNGALFYPVEARCGSLPCPRYVEGRELTCVVCTK